MEFKDITVGQYQMLYRIAKDEGLDPMDKVTESVAVVSGKSAREVDEMSIIDFNKLAADVTRILSTEITSQPKRILNAGGKTYGITYEPAKLSAGQYIEIQHFLQNGFIENLHCVLASLSYPVRKTFWGLKKFKNDPDNHVRVAEDMQDVKMIDAYSTCVFFCEVLKVSINSLRGYLEKETGEKKIQELLMAFSYAMDGFTQPKE